jgi:glucosamine kinase
VPTSSDSGARAAARDLVLGIDAGGTRTRAALAEAGARSAAGAVGPLLATGVSGPGNALSVPSDVLTGHLREAVAAAVPPGLRTRVHSVAAGLAGCSARPGDAGAHAARIALHAALADLGIRPGPVSVHSDSEVAFASGPGTPADGLVLIAGTGAVAARIAAGATVATSDGDGWLLGDAGSGFWIGRRAVRAALAELDGRGGPTLLGAAVRAYYLRESAEPAGPEPAGPGAPDGSDDPGPAGGPGTSGGAGGPCYVSGTRAAQPSPAALRERLVHAVHQRPVLDLAGLSPAVANAAGRGDRVARRILAGAAKRLAATLAPLDPRPDDVLVTTGGLLGPDGVLLPALRRRLGPHGPVPRAVPDGLSGAVALARAALAGPRRDA